MEGFFFFDVIGKTGSKSRGELFKGELFKKIRYSISPLLTRSSRSPKSTPVAATTSSTSKFFASFDVNDLAS